MFEEEDILETGICLRMETYKALNRELTIKNQELRQYGSALRDELCDVRRRLLEERTSQATLKKAVISIITESFNRILCLMYDNEADKQLMSGGFAIGDATQKENTRDTQDSRRSLHRSRNSRGHKTPSPRKSFVDDNIAVRSPLVEVQQNNITMRSRRAKLLKEEIKPKELAQETEDEDTEEDVLDRVEGKCEESKENSISYPMQLPVVIEETSSNLIDTSSISNKRGNRVYQLKLSTSTDTSGSTLIPDPTEISEKSNQSRFVKSPLTGSGDSRGELQQPLSSLTVPDIPFNDSSFNNSSMLKAPSSTPYKKSIENKSEESSLRNLRVLVPKLKQSTLSRFGISLSSTIESSHSQQSDIISPQPSTSRAGKKNKANKLTPKVEDASTSGTSSPRRRPKRRAAEAAKSNLVEPTLIVKMRRQT